MIKHTIVDPDDAFGDNTSIERRSFLVDDVLKMGDNINNISLGELCNTTRGFYALDNVLAELAYNSAPQTPGYEWMSEKNEPLLNEITDDLGILDIDYRNPEAWTKLKADIERLRQDEQKRQANEQ